MGHVTKVAGLPPDRQKDIAKRLADAGVAVTVLPATDLFVLARHADYNVPRCVADANMFVAQGCNCSISTNNVLNPFTPFGDCSLIRMANLHANILQVGHPDRLTELFSMITDRSARLMNLKDYGPKVGNQADVAVIDAQIAGRGGGDQCAGAGGIQAWPANRPAPAGGAAAPTIGVPTFR